LTLCSFSTFTEERLDRLATQYRESTNFRALVETYVKQIETAGRAACGITPLDIDTATGDQLTIIGKLLGWPRVNCNGPTEPVFGFDCGCDPSGLTIGGFCDSNWLCDDAPPRRGSYEFTDDEEYRRFLLAIRYRHRRDYTRDSLAAAARALFGGNAGVLDSQIGNPSVFTGRALTSTERTIGHLFAQVLPVAPGLRLRIYETTGAPFGFGAGWGGFCTGDFPSQVAT
jgi:hypothetical protein